MSVARKVAVVVNPRSANGKTARRWPALESALRETIGEFEVLHSKCRDHTTDLVRDTLRRGCDRIVVIGGDGTVGEAVNGFFDGDTLINSDAELVPLPQGTGSDLARMLGIPRGLKSVPHAAGTKTLKADVARVNYASRSGEAVRYFINVSHVGAGGAVAERVNRTTKAFGPFLSYLWSVVATLMTYRGNAVTVELDGESQTLAINDIVIANGAYDGGGMHVAPNACLESGVLEVYVIGNAGRMECIRNLPKLYQGRLEEAGVVQYRRVRRLKVDSEEVVYLNLDGEQCGQLPATFEVVPAAINIVTG